MSIEDMICRCLRCGHEWMKRIAGRPKNCPSCKQPNWDKQVGEVKMGRPLKKKTIGASANAPQDSPYPFPPPQILLPKVSTRKDGKARAKRAAGASAKVRSAKAKAGAAKAHRNPMAPTNKKG